MNFVKIEQVNDGRLDIFYRTNEKQLAHINEPDPGVFIGESELVIMRALDAGFKPLFFLIKENSENEFDTIFQRVDSSLTVYVVKEEIFNELKGFILIKGILACFQRKESDSLHEILTNSKRVVVLEEVENPTNVGAIFRNAAGLFADAVLLTKDTSDPLYRRSIRVSMGNVFQMKWAYIDNDTYMDILHEYGFKSVAFALKDNSIDLEDERLKKEEKLAILMGSEGYGLDDKTLTKSDYIVKINMNENVDSLNVASASGIALYELCKK